MSDNKRNCAACAFSVEADVNPADLRAARMLECHRLPPAVMVVGIDGAGHVGTTTQWPNVQPVQWCGEWQPMSVPIQLPRAGERGPNWPMAT